MTFNLALTRKIPLTHQFRELLKGEVRQSPPLGYHQPRVPPRQGTMVPTQGSGRCRRSSVEIAGVGSMQ